MRFRFPLLVSLAAASALPSCAPEPALAQAKPNIIFVLADDLGYGDVGTFFQNARRAAGDRSKPWHSTPNLDAMAAQGLQLPQHYCAAPVCAPSRASFLSGLHQGHANVRDNQFDKALEDNYTVASVLRSAGYATACIGKWGLQGKPSEDAPHGWPAHPQSRGFDSYFGYIAHGAGHAHYPKEDGKKLLEGSRDVSGDLAGSYTTDLFTARAKKWIAEQKAASPQQPFFLYLAFDTPHAKLQYPPGPFPAGGGLKGGVQWLGKPGQMVNTASGTPDSYCHPDYAGATWDDDRDAATPEVPWPEVYKRYATDVRRIDDCVGDLLATLRDLKIDDDTLVVFTSDNGPSRESYLPEKYEPTFFGSFGPFDGIKRDLWEGGIRVGAIARWPRAIKPGRVSQSPSAFWDWLPTFADAAGFPAPARTDGVSLLPTLRGTGTQKPSSLYFEYFEGGRTPGFAEFDPSHRDRPRKQMQALRIENNVGVRTNIASADDPFEIYDIVRDPKQSRNLGGDAALQGRFQDEVAGLRRPLSDAPRPYDDAPFPATRPAKSSKGLSWAAFGTKTPWVAQVDGLKPLKTGVSQGVGSPQVLAAGREVVFSGYIEAPRDGEYNFSLSGSSKAVLRLHQATVIDADSGHKPGSEVTARVRLKAGKHPFRLYTLGEASAARSLNLKWSADGAAPQEIPSSAWSH